jgi:hypothetical protein
MRDMGRSQVEPSCTLPSIVRAEGSERFALRWFKSSKRKDEALNVLTSPAKIDSEET